MIIQITCRGIIISRSILSLCAALATDIDPLPAGDGKPLCDNFDTSFDTSKWKKQSSCSGASRDKKAPVVSDGKLVMATNETAFCLTYQPSYLSATEDREMSVDVFIPADVHNETRVLVAFDIGRLGKVVRTGINIVSSDGKKDAVAGSGAGNAYGYYSPPTTSFDLEGTMESYRNMSFRMSVVISKTGRMIMNLTKFRDARADETYDFGVCTKCFDEIEPVASIQVFGGAFAGSSRTDPLTAGVEIDNFGCGTYITNQNGLLRNGF